MVHLLAIIQFHNYPSSPSQLHQATLRSKELPRKCVCGSSLQAWWNCEGGDSLVSRLNGLGTRLGVGLLFCDTTVTSQKECPSTEMTESDCTAKMLAWVTSTTFLGCLSCIRVTKECYQICWGGFSLVTWARLFFQETYLALLPQPCNQGTIQGQMCKIKETTNLTRNGDL